MVIILKEIDFDRQRRANKRFLYFMPQFKFIYIKRKCEKYCNKSKILYGFWRLRLEKYRVKYGIDIAGKTKIGRGFRIEHIGGIVVNPDAVIGCNVTMLNGVLIGAQNRGKNKGVPHIGNEVWLGTNSIVVGNIKIGDNVLIAPGAYVNFDVPSNSIVLGNPGKIIYKAKATDGYITNKIDTKFYNTLEENTEK